MKKILFVCSGNTCRSPMAMAIFNHLAGQEPPEFDYRAVSAGLNAFDDPANKNSITAVRNLWGLDLSKHRAKRLSRADIDEAFLVLTMEFAHKFQILQYIPEAHNKVFTLKEMAFGILTDIDRHNNYNESQLDIQDPYGSSPNNYELCAMEIYKAVTKLIELLKP